MSTHTGGYYLPEPSHWPIVGSLAMLCGALGATLLIHGVTGGGWLLMAARKSAWFRRGQWGAAPPGQRSTASRSGCG